MTLVYYLIFDDVSEKYIQRSDNIKHLFIDGQHIYVPLSENTVISKDTTE